MRCHDILGVPERASETEIHAAFERKTNSLYEVTCIGVPAREKKLAELNIAKEECLSWRNKSFSARTASRFTEYAEARFAPNRMNSEVCIGPCSCVDVCGGVLCTCDASNDSFCVDGCNCAIGGLSPAVFCDVAIYIAAIVGFSIAHASDKKEKRRKQEEEDRARQIERGKENIAEFQTKLAESKALVENLRKEGEDLKNKASSLERFTLFFGELCDEFDIVAIEKFSEEFNRQISDNEERISQQHHLQLSLQLQIKSESKKIGL